MNHNVYIRVYYKWRHFSLQTSIVLFSCSHLWVEQQALRLSAHLETSSKSPCTAANLWHQRAPTLIEFTRLLMSQDTMSPRWRVLLIFLVLPLDSDVFRQDADCSGSHFSEFSNVQHVSSTLPSDPSVSWKSSSNIPRKATRTAW